jgi:hypothetical protein
MKRTTTNPETKMTDKTYVAAIDLTNLTGAVYGIGHSPKEAREDAARCGAQGPFGYATITLAAREYVLEHGGSPSTDLVVRPSTVHLATQDYLWS